MAAQSRAKVGWTSIVCFIIISLKTICDCTEEESRVLASDVALKQARRKLDDIGGSISIDCGLPLGFSYTDEITDIIYTSDEELINTGVNKSISSKFKSGILPKTLENVRSFPQGERNCYTLKPLEGNDTIYLIRALFMYGDYDDDDKLPEFDLYVGVNRWDNVRFDNASHVVIKEIIHLALTGEIYVCLLNIGKGTPFISALELRHFHNTIYRTQPESALVLYRRLDVGSTTNQTVRYKDDSYDRMWVPYPGSGSINTSSTVDSLLESEYRLPSKVMQTAAKPMNINGSLEFEFETGDSSLKFYVYMHFAELEILQVNQYREFIIELNGNLWKESVVPEYLNSTTRFSKYPMKGSKLSFSLRKTSKSTLPPILNALEIYVLKDFLQASTDQGDVNAIMNIKSRYQVGEGWQGDPCEPKYSWDGLTCSYNGIYHRKDWQAG
ncbi:putative leucine-rich repeat receptor-like protein kinase At2g19210 isoform X2 [Pistacia vera]|uniref:putative leucine-rich repeat receptor-like protein kinase At2g19210 isoform X2 n=1 Tax=Pistacia vera TaxID=55513 RepID=UPI00126391D3|nr:putative leucine-rich repeat receptor-like protein kinase At2g19210 isoform X2 [Pistacia vera]